jgi:hypothetical protein
MLDSVMFILENAASQTWGTSFEIAFSKNLPDIHFFD